MQTSRKQEERLTWLLSATKNFANKGDLVAQYTKGRTRKSAEMAEEECEELIKHLSELSEKLNQQRRRIFSMIRSIKMIDADEKLSEADVLRYIRQIKNLKLSKVDRLNDYTTEELRKINTKLDAIKPKQEKKWRTQMNIA